MDRTRSCYGSPTETGGGCGIRQPKMEVTTESSENHRLRHRIVCAGTDAMTGQMEATCFSR